MWKNILTTRSPSQYIPFKCSHWFYVNIGSANEIKDCGGGWTLIHQACYRISAKTAAWLDAHNECQADGGSLLTVKTLYELVCKIII